MAVSSTAMTGWVDGSLAMMVGIRPLLARMLLIRFIKMFISVVFQLDNQVSLGSTFASH